MESDNLRKDHGNSLTEHDSFSLNSANAPSGNTETVDHGSVRVSSNHRVGIQVSISVEDNGSKVLEIDLMDDTTAGWDNFEIVKSFRPPFKELEALFVAAEFHLFVDP